MTQDFPLNQGQWLVQFTNTGTAVQPNYVAGNVANIQSLGGVCHAMSTEWMYAQIEGRAWNANEEYWRAVSHQRAYALAWQDTIRANMAAGNYAQYINIALGSTQSYVEDPAGRKGLNFQQLRTANVNSLPLVALPLTINTGMIIVMFGSDMNEPPSKQNWGHTVAMHRDRQGQYRYLDVNDGQYSWANGTPLGTIGQDVVNDLSWYSQNFGIRDVYYFIVG